jgi:hypothetical protein
MRVTRCSCVTGLSRLRCCASTGLMSIPVRAMGCRVCLFAGGSCRPHLTPAEGADDYNISVEELVSLAFKIRVNPKIAHLTRKVLIACCRRTERCRVTDA